MSATSISTSPVPDMDRIRFRRRGLPKTKSGCRTCRTRHLKCGEERPRCLRCVNRGDVCEWPQEPVQGMGNVKMASRPRQLLPKNLDIAPSPARSGHRSRPKTFLLLPNINYLTPLIPNPSKMLFNDDEERRYFEVFSTKTAFEILPSFDSGTLRHILLQACVSDASIRHAVVALGALDITAESLKASGNSPLNKAGREYVQHHQNALKQYTTAIQYMRAAASTSMQDLRTTVLTCLVIFCFEAWDGVRENAVRQIQTGLRLIRNWQVEHVNKHGRIQKQTADLEQDLMRTFNRLDVQVISFASPEDYFNECQDFHMAEEEAILNRMPQVFSSVEDAEIYESVILRQAMRFLVSQVPLPKQPPPLVTFPINGWHGVRLSSVVAIQQSIIVQMSRWDNAFNPLWRRLKAKNDRGLLMAAMLRMHLKSAYIGLLQVCMEDEMTWDDFQPLFTEIIELAEYTLNELDVAKSSTPKFQFDSHIVIPLSMVSHKCRDPKLRRRAIYLQLRNARREGVWDSHAAGACAAWAMEIEEEHLEHGKIPGWARIHGVAVEREKEPQRVHFSCAQRLGPISEEVVIRRKAIDW